ncbi:uncharacterized protein [Amphiura filiformis]|uniref:uncharacterized protein n=1 Tax=Amphiura filiformis TaxID=82378 RepID=UPI003B222DD1
MLSEIFEKFGEVVECDVIRNYGFVHMTNETEGQEAITNLDDSNFMGSKILVQFSTTDVHKAPGVGSAGECFRCGNRGHLSRECPEGGTKPRRRGGRGGRGGGGGGGGYRGGRDRGRAAMIHTIQIIMITSSQEIWTSPGYDYDRRPPMPRDYPYPPPYRSRSRSPPGRRPPADMYMRRGRSPPRDYRDYYDRPPMPRDYYDMPPPRRDAPVSYPLPSAYRDRPSYNDRGYQDGASYRPRGGVKAPPQRPAYPKAQPFTKRGAFTNGSSSNNTLNGQLNGAFTEDVC